MRQLSALVDGTDILFIGDEVYEHVIFDGRRHESLLRYPELRARACVISSFGKTFHTTGWKVGYCVAPQPILAEVQRVHQFMTFTVHTPSQFAFAEFVSRDPMAAELAAFYQRKRDLFLSLIDGSRFKPLACEGTYFQLLDYSAIAHDTDRDMAMRFITEHGVASIPCSAFLYKDRRRTGAALLLCEEGRDAASGGRATASHLIQATAGSHVHRFDSFAGCTSSPLRHSRPDGRLCNCEAVEPANLRTTPTGYRINRR